MRTYLLFHSATVLTVQIRGQIHGHHKLITLVKAKPELAPRLPASSRHSAAPSSLRSTYILERAETQHMKEHREREGEGKFQGHEAQKGTGQPADTWFPVERSKGMEVRINLSLPPRISSAMGGTSWTVTGESTPGAPCCTQGELL